MTYQLRIVLIILILLTFSMFVSQIKQKKLNLQYTLTWILLLFCILLVTIFPSLLNLLANLMGIALPINMIFFLGFVFTLVIIFRLTSAISKQSEQIKEITQKIALMEKKEYDNK